MTTTTTNGSAMNYQDCIKLAAYYAELAQKIKEETIDSILIQMAMAGITIDDISNGFASSKPTSTQKQEVISGNEQTTPAIPEAVQTSAAAEGVENNESSTQMKPKSAFDDPALDAPYVPKAAKKKAKTAPKIAEKSTQDENQDTPAPPVECDPKGAQKKLDSMLTSTDDSTSVASEDSLSPMEELLSNDTTYKEYYQGKPSGKKKRKILPMEELLSEPINKILLMGNEFPRGASFRQHGRFVHADGIIPTETATGRTGIYIR